MTWNFDSFLEFPQIPLQFPKFLSSVTFPATGIENPLKGARGLQVIIILNRTQILLLLLSA